MNFLLFYFSSKCVRNKFVFPNPNTMSELTPSEINFHICKPRAFPYCMLE